MQWQYYDYYCINPVLNCAVWTGTLAQALDAQLIKTVNKNCASKLMFYFFVFLKYLTNFHALWLKKQLVVMYGCGIPTF